MTPERERTSGRTPEVRQGTTALAVKCGTESTFARAFDVLVGQSDHRSQRRLTVDDEEARRRLVLRSMREAVAWLQSGLDGDVELLEATFAADAALRPAVRELLRRGLS